MSYCRWSSDNFKCDIYAYEDVKGGYTIHVASNKIVTKLPKRPKILDCSAEEYMRREKKFQKAFDKAKHESIGLKYDGESFWCRTLSAFSNKMIELRNEGYRIPDHVFEMIEEEIENNQKNT